MAPGLRAAVHLALNQRLGALHPHSQLRRRQPEALSCISSPFNGKPLQCTKADAEGRHLHPRMLSYVSIMMHDALITMH